MQGQLDAIPGQMQALKAELVAQMQAQLAQHNAPAIAAAAATTVQSITASRMENRHDRSDVTYVVVPRYDGSAPPNWPVGFDRTALVEGPIGDVDLLIGDYGLPLEPPPPYGYPGEAGRVRRNVLAVHIGTFRV